MTTENKIKILFVAVIFLAVLNIATFASILWHIRKVDAGTKRFLPVENSYRPRHRPWRGPDRERSAFNLLMDSLQLSPSQRKYFIQRRKSFIRSHRPMMDSLKIYHHLLDSLLCSDNPDTMLIKFYSRRIGYLHYRFVVDNSLMFRDFKMRIDKKQQQTLCHFIRNPRPFYHKRYRFNKKR